MQDLIEQLEALVKCQEESSQGEWIFYDDDELIECNGGGICRLVPYGNINTIAKNKEHFKVADGRFITAAHEFPFKELLMKLREHKG